MNTPTVTSSEQYHLPPLAERARPGSTRLLLFGLFLAIIFISGGITGTAVTLVFNAPTVESSDFRPPRNVEHMLTRFREQYDLSEDQLKKIEASAQKMNSEMAEIHREYHPRIRKVADRFEDEVSNVLNDEQRAKWQESLRQHKLRREEHRARWRERGGRRGGPDGGPPGPPPESTSDAPAGSHPGSDLIPPHMGPGPRPDRGGDRKRPPRRPGEDRGRQPRDSSWAPDKAILPAVAPDDEPSGSDSKEVEASQPETSPPETSKPENSKPAPVEPPTSTDAAPATAAPVVPADEPVSLRDSPPQAAN